MEGIRFKVDGPTKEGRLRVVDCTSDHDQHQCQVARLISLAKNSWLVGPFVENGSAIFFLDTKAQLFPIPYFGPAFKLKETAPEKEKPNINSNLPTLFLFILFIRGDGPTELTVYLAPDGQVWHRHFIPAHLNNITTDPLD